MAIADDDLRDGGDQQQLQQQGAVVGVVGAEQAEHERRQQDPDDGERDHQPGGVATAPAGQRHRPLREAGALGDQGAADVAGDQVQRVADRVGHEVVGAGLRPDLVAAPSGSACRRCPSRAAPRSGRWPRTGPAGPPGSPAAPAGACVRRRSRRTSAVTTSDGHRGRQHEAREDRPAAAKASTGSRAILATDADAVLQRHPDGLAADRAARGPAGRRAPRRPCRRRRRARRAGVSAGTPARSAHSGWPSRKSRRPAIAATAQSA